MPHCSRRVVVVFASVLCAHGGMDGYTQYRTSETSAGEALAVAGSQAFPSGPCPKTEPETRRGHRGPLIRPHPTLHPQAQRHLAAPWEGHIQDPGPDPTLLPCHKPAGKAAAGAAAPDNFCAPGALSVCPLVCSEQQAGWICGCRGTTKIVSLVMRVNAGTRLATPRQPVASLCESLMV